MDVTVHAVQANTDDEDVARIFQKYDYTMLPVVDSEHRLLGIVTVDDIIDVLYDEATEDILKLAGAGSELSPHATVREHLRQRYPWLIASCIGGFLAALIMDPFLDTLGAFLVFFVPIVMGMAGNVGIQSSTVVVRGIATGQIVASQSGVVIRREIVIGFLMGCGYGVVVGIAAAAYSAINGAGADMAHILFYGLSVGLALSSAILIAATLGTAIPIGLNRLGVDPAVATGPFVTTALDVLGILAYFGIALLLAGLFAL